jgi:hypothetical protein
MIAFVLGLFLMQAAPQGTGFVTGTVRSGNGSPAPRVRVYAITYRDAVEAATKTTPPALESLTETDATGSYRLELQPGRYHIATGSVASPTYFPGTTDISTARVLTIARDVTIPDINFGAFVPATRGTTSAPRPTGNGVLSGVLRYPDGTPASGINVIAIPNATPGRTVSYITLPGPGLPNAVVLPNINIVSSITTTVNVVSQTLTLLLNSLNGNSQVVTDANGAYQIPNLAPDTYNIVAGYAEDPVFYPGVADATLALGQVIAMNSKIDKLDFTVPRRPPGVTVSGSVSTTSGLPVTGAIVRIRPRDNPSVAAARFGLPLRSPQQTATVAADGLFSFPDVQAGAFVVEASYAGIPNQRQEVVVSGQPLTGLRAVLPVTMFSGRILLEDGRPVPNPEVFGEAILTTASNPNMLASTLMPISAAGTFSRLIEADEFRFYMRSLPEEYEIKSLKAGTVDLLKETLKISGKDLVEVEMRVARRSTVPAAAQVSGTVRDSTSGLPLTGRITLCCAQSGPAENVSAPLAADGSFAFATLPAGKYLPTLQMPGGNAGLYIVGTGIDIGTQGLRGVTLFTAGQFGQVSATIRSDGASPLPDNVNPSISFVNPVSGFRVVAERNPAGDYVAMLPLGAKYDVRVEQLPEGFVVKSQPGPVEPSANAANVLFRSPEPRSIAIDLGEAPRP